MKVKTVKLNSTKAWNCQNQKFKTIFLHCLCFTITLSLFWQSSPKRPTK